jgi:uncharacterized protein YndB with AHSA1/START domain
MMQRSCRASVTIDAPVDEVWAVVSDVTRVGEWSGECRGCDWQDGAGAPVRGARFRGRNRRGGLRWTRLNEVTAAERPRRLAWRTVPRFPYPDSVEWELTLEARPSGTEVRESFDVVKLPKVMEWGIGIVMPAHRDRSADLGEDLTRLKELVESGRPGGRDDRKTA